MMAGKGSFWDTIEDKVFAPLWFRRLFGVLIGLMVAYWPIYVLWRVIAGPPVDWTSFEFVASTAGFFIVAVGLGVILAPTLGHSPLAAAVLLAPLVGGVFAVMWTWRVAPTWQSNAERRSIEGRVLDGLSELDRSVFEYRFELDQTRFYSRRKVARRLGITVDEVIQAEKRIEAKFASEKR